MDYVAIGLLLEDHPFKRFDLRLVRFVQRE